MKQHWDALSTNDRGVIYLSPHGVKCIGQKPPVIIPHPSFHSSYRSASLRRPGAIPSGPSPISDYALDANGVSRRFLIYGYRKTNIPDLGFIGTQAWWEAGQPAPDPASRSEYLDQVTINRYDAEVTSHFGGATVGSGLYYRPPDTPVGTSWENVVESTEFESAGGLSYKQVVNWTLVWGEYRCPVKSIYETFWKEELTLSAVISEVEALYTLLPELIIEGPGYCVTRDAGGAIIDGSVLGYAFDDCPAGMGLMYRPSALCDLVSKCGALLWNPDTRLQKILVTFDITGQLTETRTDVTPTEKPYYPIEADAWQAANIVSV